MILEWLGVPSDRTDILIILGVTIGATILFLVLSLIFERQTKLSKKAWLMFFYVSLVLFSSEIIIFAFNDTPSAAQIAENKAKEKNNEENNSEEIVDTSVSYADIYREFKRNELVAKDFYDGNRYQITAKVTGMSTSGLLNLTGGATLTMETRVDNIIVYFTAEFEREQEENLKTISVGDTITFIGTCYGATFSDCELQ